MKTRNTIT